MDNILPTLTAEQLRDPDTLTVTNLYSGWREMTLTNKLIAILQHDRESVLKAISETSMSPGASETALRILGVRLNEINNTLNYVTNPTQFINKLKICNRR